MARCDTPHWDHEDKICGIPSKDYFIVKGDDWTTYNCLCKGCQEEAPQEGWDLERISKEEYEVRQVMES